MSINNYKRQIECPKCNKLANRDINDFCRSFKGDKDFYDGDKLK